ncbi:MAG: NAD(P)-dependent oxidoreductase [Candidatus Lokiarchaeia archaeon]
MNESIKKADNSDKGITVCFISNVSEQIQDYLIEKLKSLDNVELIFRKINSKKSLNKLVPKADILIGWRPSKKILLKATNLKLFINPGAGVQHLIELFRDINKIKKVFLINGHGNSYFVAQHTVALLLALLNKIIPHHEWMRQGRWRTGDEDAVSIPLRFRKVGLLGYGAINQKVHRFLSGFDIEFSILRKHWENQENSLPKNVKRYEFSQLNQFLTSIDILIIAIPVTSLTKKMLGRNEFELLGSNGILVNVSRGEIIDEESLFYALKEKVIQGASIDVWYNYSPENDEEGKKYPFNFPFHSLDNIILSPHRGYSPFNDLLRWNEVIENITRMAQGRQDFINVVNLQEEY